MTLNGLKFINKEMETCAIHYEFEEFKEDISEIDTYWIGDYVETSGDSEDGGEETQFILTGTTRKTWRSLEEVKETIQKRFPRIGGKTAILEDGSGIAVFYENAHQVPTDDTFKRMQINLKVMEWRA